MAEHSNQKTIDEANIRRILLFLEDHDQLHASWENAADFLSFLKYTMRLNFRGINRAYLKRLYAMYREQLTLNS